MNEHIQKLENELAEIKAFQSDEDYAQAESELHEAFNRGDLNLIKEIIT